MKLSGNVQLQLHRVRAHDFSNKRFRHDNLDTIGCLIGIFNVWNFTAGPDSRVMLWIVCLLCSSADKPQKSKFEKLISSPLSTGSWEMEIPTFLCFAREKWGDTTDREMIRHNEFFIFIFLLVRASFTFYHMLSSVSLLPSRYFSSNYSKLNRFILHREQQGPAMFIFHSLSKRSLTLFPLLALITLLTNSLNDACFTFILPHRAKAQSSLVSCIGDFYHHRKGEVWNVFFFLMRWVKLWIHDWNNTPHWRSFSHSAIITISSMWCSTRTCQITIG